MMIIWMFSTHPRLFDSNGQCKVHWVSERELETNIKTLCQSQPKADAEFWARLFVNTFEREPLALRHMTAYLEKIGHKAAKKVYAELKNFPQFNYSQSDIWQIAWSFSSTPDIFFRKFDHQHRLENYAVKIMEYKIKDEIVSLGMHKKRSEWGLLRSKARVYLQEALQHRGYREPRLSCYLLTWDCFKKIYKPQRASNSRSLPKPTVEQLHKMASEYNKQLQSSPQVAKFGTANQETIEAWLDKCTQALRAYETRHFVSLDSPTPGNKDSSPLSETISDYLSSESQCEQIEIQESIPALKTMLTSLLTQIDKDADNLLLLRYGFDLDYRTIDPILGIGYTTVGDRKNRLTQQLVMHVAQWAQKDLNVTPDSESLNEMHTQLKACLKKYYKDLIFRSVFWTAWQQLDCQYRNILYLHYFRGMDVPEMVHQLQLDEQEVNHGLITGGKELAAAIREWIQNHLNTLPDLLNPLANKIAVLVQELIANFPDTDFERQG